MTIKLYRDGIVSLLFKTMILVSIIMVTSGSSFEQSKGKAVDVYSDNELGALENEFTEFEEPRHTNLDFYLGGGLSLAVGSFSNGWEIGLHGDGRFGFSIGKKVDVLLGIDYHAFSPKSSGVFTLGDGKLTALMFVADLKMNMGSIRSPSKPYMLAGIGMAGVNVSIRSSFDPYSSNKSLNQTKPFFELGFGAQFGKFFIQGKYVNIFTKGNSLGFIPVTLGVAL